MSFSDGEALVYVPCDLYGPLLFIIGRLQEYPIWAFWVNKCSYYYGSVSTYRIFMCYSVIAFIQKVAKIYFLSLILFP